jgi:peptide/nickel transport system substrate-binding protein
VKTSNSRRYRLAAAIMVGALALAGCANSSSEDDDGNKESTPGGLSKAEIYTNGLVGETDDSGDPTTGGTLTVADFGEPRVLNPAQTYANGATGGSAMAAIYDTLMRYDVTTKTFEPQLAESLTSEDDTTWTLKLRDGIEFTDGTTLDADAMLASLEYYQANYAYQSLLMLANVAEMKKTDDQTVVFTLRSPWATFPNMLAQGPGMVMAPAAYKDPENFKPIGAGPFVLDTYAAGEELVLNANPDYWNGAPYLDSLRFIWLGGADDQPKLDALESGDADTAFLRDAAVVEKARNEGLSGMMFAFGLNDNLWINTREGSPGADVRVRQAINYAFDPEAYMERTLGGAGLPTKNMFAESSPWYSGADLPEPDVAKATELLDAAKADGYDGTIRYSHAADASSQAGGVAIKAMLEAAGFKVGLDPIRSVADQVPRMYVDHDYDLAVGATTVPDEDPYSRLAGALGSQSPSNASGYASPEMDALLAELQAVGDSPEDGVSTMTEIEALWAEDVPGVSIAAGGTFQPWNDNVHGIVPTTETMFLYDKAWKE